MRRIVLARIGWMKFYAGSQPNDERPIGGGQYNIEKIGNEINAFKKRKGKVCVAFMLAAFSERLNLQRIDPNASGKTLDDVLVIFFAQDQRRDPLGQVIIGWYNNAKVYEWYKNTEWGENTETRIINAVLLPTMRRNLVIPHGKNAPGQSNTFFVLNKDGEPKRLPWLKNVLEFIDNYSGPNLVTNPQAEAEPEIETARENALVTSLGQGIALDPSTRKVVENVAMKAAIKYFNNHGYTVKDVSSRESYDLHSTNGKRKLLVEVKGTQSQLSSITLTPNEVQLAKRSKNIALFVQHSIKVRKHRKIVKASGGMSFIMNPWKINLKSLKPIAWEYTIK